MRWAILFSIALFLWPSRSYALWELGGGARALGMGGATSALSDDPGALAANPAGIAGQDGLSVLLSSSSYFRGLDDGRSMGYNFMGLVIPTPIEMVKLGISVEDFNAGDLYGEVSVLMAIGVGMGIGKGSLNLGADIRVRRWDSVAVVAETGEELEHLRGKWTPSFDLGLLWRPGGATSFGLVFGDLGGFDISSGKGEGEKIPFFFKIGFYHEVFGFGLSLDTSVKQGIPSVYVGSERWMANGRAGLRAGLAFLDVSQGTNISFGITLVPYQKPKVSVDYSYSHPIGTLIDAGGIHRIDILFKF